MLFFIEAKMRFTFSYLDLVLESLPELMAYSGRKKCISRHSSDAHCPQPRKQPRGNTCSLVVIRKSAEDASHPINSSKQTLTPDCL